MNMIQNKQNEFLAHVIAFCFSSKISKDITICSFVWSLVMHIVFYFVTTYSLKYVLHTLGVKHRLPAITGSFICRVSNFRVGLKIYCIKEFIVIKRYNIPIDIRRKCHSFALIGMVWIFPRGSDNALSFASNSTQIYWFK